MIIEDGFLGIIERPGNVVGGLLYCKFVKDGIYNCVKNGVNIIVEEGEYMITGSLRKDRCREVNDYILVYWHKDKSEDGLIYFEVDSIIEEKEAIAKELLR